MSSVTSDFSELTKTQPENSSFHRKVSSAIKQTRSCQRRKILNIMPLRLDVIQKQIEEATTNKGETLTHEKLDENKENELEVPLSKLQDSFDINFGSLSINTPAKPTETVRKTEFITPCVNNKPMVPVKSKRELEFPYVTPNNKIPTKVQCSVKLNPYINTPISKLCDTSDFVNIDCDSKTVQLSLPKVDFKKIKVNNVDYIILNELGKGGSSEVFQCYNLEAKSLRAIKVVSLENKSSAVGFINEVKVLETLQKCNRIIKMYDFEIKEQEKILLVVLEVGGTDLSKILKESAANTKHMPLYMLLYYWMEMLYAVKQIHSHGIIHSDLKPANFLKVEGYLKLIDFGIASCVQNDMTSVIKTVPEGSFNYISPEALCNESSLNSSSPSFGKPKYKISYKSDVWSLGCILYQLVYRRTPFQHITQIWMKLATIVDSNHQIDYPEADWVPQKIVNTIKSCLQRNIKMRPSIDDLIHEYENMFYNLQ